MLVAKALPSEVNWIVRGRWLRSQTCEQDSVPFLMAHFYPDCQNLFIDHKINLQGPK